MRLPNKTTLELHEETVTVEIRQTHLPRTKTPRYQQILKPGEEGILEIEWNTPSDELNMKSAGCLLEEQLIYVPNVPFPELPRVEKSLLAPEKHE
jgi:hypothetical protein